MEEQPNINKYNKIKFGIEPKLKYHVLIQTQPYCILPQSDYVTET
jgi:hypothetical protein